MSKLFILEEEVIDITEIPDMSIEQILDLLKTFDKKVENKKSVKIALQLVLKTMLRFISEEPTQSPIKNRTERLVREVYLLSTKLRVNDDGMDLETGRSKSDYELVEDDISNLLKVKQTEHLCQYAYNIDIRSIYYMNLDFNIHTLFYQKLMQINPVGALFLRNMDYRIIALSLIYDSELESCIRKLYGDKVTESALSAKNKLLNNHSENKK